MMRDSSGPPGRAAAAKKGPVRQDRLCKRGSLLFIEGDEGNEMFVVKSGKIRLLKQEGDNTIVTAEAGPGAVIGEMALLLREQRTVTAQVVEDSVVIPIDEETYEATLKNIPPWLGGALQSLVKRLSETHRLCGVEMVQKGIAGVVRVLLLLAEIEGTRECEGIAVPLGRVKEILYGTTGLSDVEMENIFLHLILKRMIRITRADSGLEYINIKKPAVLHLYYSYLRARQRGEPFLSENMPLSSLDLAGFILATEALTRRADRNEFITVTLPELETEWQLRGKKLPIDNEAIKTLAETAKDGEGSALVFNCKRLRLLHLAGTWLPIFKEDVKF
jgi:CRP/FNR family cyclic AMP-dependent transcriptional regulator